MAFIGNLDSIMSMFSRTKALQELCNYMQEASNPKSAIYKRIINTQGENKIPLGKGMIAIEQSYKLKPDIKAFYESHRKYIDFQLVVLGEELFYIVPNTQCKIKAQYDKAKDLIIYYPPNAYSTLHLKAQTLAVFLPQDVHSGGLGVQNLGERMIVYKSVIKIPCKNIKMRF